MILFLLVGPVKGQFFNGGIMAGVAGTQIAGDTYSGFHKAGIYAGGFVNLQISKRSIFQLELEYFQKGSRKNPNYEEDDFDQYLFRVNYIEMPVLYQYVINERLKLEVGPSLGFLTGYYEEKNTEEIKGGIRPARVTFQINAGIYVTLTRRLMFNLRTNNSLLNIRSDNATGDVLRIFPGNYGQFNDCLVMSIAYQFRDTW
ncbi:MAG: PorT family protein [Bacteroidales bacterium]|nr:PorT family protein [Bacteroidales bacterium]